MMSPELESPQHILYVTPYAPNPIRVRPFNLVRALLACGHHVTLAAVCSHAQDQADLDALCKLGAEVVATRVPSWRSLGKSVGGLFGKAPLQAVYSWERSFAETLVHLVEKRRFDVVHVEHLRGARYGEHLKRVSASNRPPVVWDSVDCISYLFEQAAQQSSSFKGRLLARLELGRTRRYEGWLVHKFDQVLVTSEADRAALAKLAMDAAGPGREAHLDHKIHVVPNGVDMDYFSPNGASRSPARIVLTGKMSYHANVTAALYLVRDIMPLVWAQCPDAKVWIVGKDPSREVRALATSTNAVSGKVVVTGTVADLRPYLHKATLAVAPVSYGAGIQNKVLEAMACGAPVVASTQAVSALAVEPGRDLLVASEARAFAAAILDLFGNPQLRKNLGQNGRAYVERNHSWEVAGDMMSQAYAQAICAQGRIE